MTDELKKIAFLGAGTMGEALLNGSLIGGVDPDTVTVTSRHRERADQLASTYGVQGTTDTAAAVTEAQLVIVALPPDSAPDTLRSLADTLRPDSVVVSLADGVGLSDLAEILPDGVGVVRAMPSLTARVGQGLTLLTAHSCSETQLDHVTWLFSRSGEVFHVEEDQQARLAPLSSGGSAHILYVVDAMVEAAALRGVPRDVARKVMTQTLTGTAALLDGHGDLPPPTVEGADLRSRRRRNPAHRSPRPPRSPVRYPRRYFRQVCLTSGGIRRQYTTKGH